MLQTKFVINIKEWIVVLLFAIMLLNDKNCTPDFMQQFRTTIAKTLFDCLIYS